MGGNAAILDLPAVGLVLDVGQLSACLPQPRVELSSAAVSNSTGTLNLDFDIAFRYGSLFFERWEGTRAGGTIDHKAVQCLRTFYVS
jgi:hypothetical protein